MGLAFAACGRIASGAAADSVLVRPHHPAFILSMLDVTPRMHSDAVDVRTVRPSGKRGPRLSVVSVAQDDSPATLRSIAERCARWERLGIELIVVCACRHAARAMASGLAGARMIHAPDDATEVELRSLGLTAATGDVVMLVADPAAADDRWIEHLSTNSSARALPQGA